MLLARHWVGVRSRSVGGRQSACRTGAHKRRGARGEQARSMRKEEHSQREEVSLALPTTRRCLLYITRIQDAARFTSMNKSRFRTTT